MKRPHKINLANIPTPFQKILFRETSFYIKRDDFTGVELTGNKVRKLEYLIADALKKKCTRIFTCGGEQSNHCRATAIASLSNNFGVDLFLRGKERKKAEGNLFLNSLTGVQTHFVNADRYRDINNVMETEKKHLEAEGVNVYIIPEGGSSPVGIRGYFDAAGEIKNQMNTNKFNGILTAAGSGGTAAGLLAGFLYHGMKTKVLAVNVLLTGQEMKQKILELTEEYIRFFNLSLKLDERQLEVIEGYSSEGYENITPDKMILIKSFFRKTGILLDPVYTGKAFNAYFKEVLIKNRNSKVIFLHTGGIFGVFARRKDYLQVE